jgi:hypothetical protein
MGKDWYDGCWQSQEWRLNHLYWIECKDGRPRRFRMNWAQERFYRGMWYRNNILKARQLGMSTLISILILDGCLFRENWHAGINDKSMDCAKEKLAKIRFAYESMDRRPARGFDYVEDEEDRANIERFAREWYEVTKGTVTATRGDWATGSSVVIGTALRSMTLQFLHVSELGHVAANFKKKAKEIQNGSFPCVGDDGVIVMESTHEGGKEGLNYQMTRAAMENTGKRALLHDEYKFFFFAWHGQPEYRAESDEPLRLSHDMVEYFDGLEKEGIALTDAQKRWYAAKFAVHAYSMRQEFPSTPEEAFDAQVEGAIYGMQITALRYEGKLKQVFEAEPDFPLYVAWDIGMSDYTSLWLVQPRGDGQFYVLDCYVVNGKGLEHLVGVVRAWEALHGQSIKRHFLPHDGVQRESDAVRYVTKLQLQGLPCVVLKRIKDVWLGINMTKRVLRRCVFHERCSEPRVIDGMEYMSGVNALESYRTAPVGAYGVERPTPLHDRSSHASDAFRYFCEAYDAGLVDRHLVGEVDGYGAGVSGLGRGMARGVPWRR